MAIINEWLSIDKTSGTGNAQITLTASSYQELVERTQSLVIQGQRESVYLNVKQNGVIPKTEEELKQQYFWVEFEETNGTITFQPRWTAGSNSIPAGKYSNIAYSFDGISWASGTTIKMNDATIVYLENKSGRLNNIATADIGKYEWEIINFDKRARVGGPINTLSSFKKGCFYELFSGNSYLTDASKLILPWKTMEKMCYYGMFSGCKSLIRAPKLPATTLADRCYDGMFSGCTSLTTAPELPVTTLVDGCYAQMFSGCTSLTTAPELPATRLANYCYYLMFHGCTSLTTAPVLPATKVYDECYGSMFYGCTNLVNAPTLPATTLVGGCYSAMFRGCTSLTTAPVLPAKSLTHQESNGSYTGCYNSMFYGCTSLNYIKMLGDYTDWSYTRNWVYGVAPTGTFIKLENSSIKVDGYDGIPSGWTVETATE